MMALVLDSSRAFFLILIATGFAWTSGTLYKTLTDGVGNVIVPVVSNTNNSVDDLYGDIDKSLAVMNLALGSIEAVQVSGGTGDKGSGTAGEVGSAKTRNLIFAGFGTAGPGIMAGVMLTLNKVAMALFTAFGPLFILCLIFDQTKSLFQRWLLYGIGTIFSLAVLYVMSTIAMDLTLAIAAKFWVADRLFAGFGEQGLNNMAMQQVVVGVILTMLLVTAPGMAASFFQGTLGQFVHYSQLDARGAQPGPGGPAGSPGASRLPGQQQQAANTSNESIAERPSVTTTQQHQPYTGSSPVKIPADEIKPHSKG